MKSHHLFMLGLILLSQSLFAGQSKVGPIVGSTTIACCGFAQYSVEVENIHPMFAIAEINGTYVVTRQSQVIYQETIEPGNSELSPGETQTFVLEIPMELLLIDGLIEIFFEFGSEFDLNPDPTASLNAFVTGCGMLYLTAAALVKAGFEAEAEERDAYIFLIQELLKPGTIIRGSGKDTYTRTLTEFTWLAMIYNPLMRFEQPVEVVLVDANTGDNEVIDANWPPIIFDEIYVPDLEDQDRISGELPPNFPPPVPFTFESVPSIPVDSVCAILVSGVDTKQTMQESFNQDMELMKGVLTHHMHGPRLPESSILIRHSKNGYGRDSLLMDLDSLKNKYKKVYFYYTGHGSKNGELCLGPFGIDYLDYTTFTDRLFDSGARNFCIMMDACYSGLAIDAICNHPKLQQLDVEVVTSANNAKTSVSTFWTIGGVNRWFGKFTSQFFWAMSDITADKNRDGKVSFSEGFNNVNMTNFQGITDLQCPQMKNPNNYTFRQKGELLYEKGLEAFGDPVTQASLGLFPYTLTSGTEVISFDQVNTYSLPTSGFLGWIDWNPNALFGKPITYAFIDSNTNNVTFQEGSQFWPTLPFCPEFDPFSPEYIYASGLDYLTGEPLNTIHTEAQEPPVPSPSNIAIIIPGWHPDPVFNDALYQSAETFRINLIQEEFGEKIHEDNIEFHPHITVSTLGSILASYTDQYDKVYFYFTGNISNTGFLALGMHPDEWMSMPALVESLATIDATAYTLFLDGSYSGLVVDYIKLNNVFADKQIDVFTGSGNDVQAYVDIFVDPEMNIVGVQSAMTYHLMQAYGDPAAEGDGTEGITMKEAFHTTFILNPVKTGGKPLFELSHPINISGRVVSINSQTPAIYSFDGLDLDVHIEHRSGAFDVYGSQEMNIREQTTSALDVFEITPVRQWTIEGELGLDASQKADLVFHYQEDIDLMAGTQGVLGLVSRATPEDEWRAWYPSEFNAPEKLITAKNVNSPGEWAIARIEEMVGVYDPISGLSGFSLFPNPAKEMITAAFVLESPTELLIRIADINGQVIYIDDNKPYGSGEQTIALNISSLNSGIYVLELIKNKQILRKLFVRQ